MHTLLDRLEQLYPDSSRRTLKNWVKWGRVFVDGMCHFKCEAILSPDQKISLEKKDPRLIAGLPLLYEDRWMIVIHKPSGLLSVPAENDRPHALGLLRTGFRSQTIHAVHRIDEDTSGVLLFARGTVSEKLFDTMFEAHDLEREYAAIVEGYRGPQQGTFQSYLREKENYDVEVTTPEKGRLAITHYEMVGHSKKYSHLRLRLETGRKHQIRVHLAEAGYPIVGDKRYGSQINPIKRLCLHSHRLAFVHPFTGKKMDFSSPIPQEFERLGYKSKT